MLLRFFLIGSEIINAKKIVFETITSSRCVGCIRNEVFGAEKVKEKKEKDFLY